jgi:putative polyhydroxyalkanoic acid system protein
VPRAASSQNGGNPQGVVSITAVLITIRKERPRMPALKMNFPHQLGQSTAQQRLQGLLEKVKSRYGDQISNLRESWVDNVLDFGFTTYGFAINGKVFVEDNDVRLDGQIPFAAMMFKGKIEQGLREQMTKLLA